MIQRIDINLEEIASPVHGEYVRYTDHRAAVRELVEALQAMLAAAPVAPTCETFHHARRDQHLFGECPPLARHLAALEDARAAIAKHQEEKE